MPHRRRRAVQAEGRAANERSSDLRRAWRRPREHHQASRAYPHAHTPHHRCRVRPLGSGASHAHETCTDLSAYWTIYPPPPEFSAAGTPLAARSGPTSSTTKSARTRPCTSSASSLLPLRSATPRRALLAAAYSSHSPYSSACTDNRRPSLLAPHACASLSQGIVYRDIKPANTLLDDSEITLGEPPVIQVRGQPPAERCLLPPVVAVASRSVRG